jgi:hypothetical protein
MKIGDPSPLPQMPGLTEKPKIGTTVGDFKRAQLEEHKQQFQDRLGQPGKREPTAEELAQHNERCDETKKWADDKLASGEMTAEQHARVMEKVERDRQAGPPDHDALIKQDEERKANGAEMPKPDPVPRGLGHSILDRMK